MNFKTLLSISAMSITLIGCMHQTSSNTKYRLSSVNKASLQSVVDARSSETKQRDNWRKPAETLAFFRVEPGMTVAEALPGGGWYTEIIANYLGSNGGLIGLNYNDDMWPKFGFFSEEAIKGQIARTAQFPSMVASKTTNGIKAAGYTFSNTPATANGTLDRILVIRALHNLNRFENDGGYRTKALKAMHRLLKPNGMVGVVQHKVAESTSDEGANGQRGYLKESAVIAMFEAAGFKLIDSSDMHANPKDVPGPKDIVWRLPPTLLGAQDKPELKAAMNAIGESNRMTLLFQKQ
ncbi:class I SAM-dependent methyltransferase [Kangiella sp. HZ709]|uniref:class I SAM-dependent methyltransferase n=1 Tax=Kangiella sp. HZ709 TaxID=2666328 RepID=UPI0012B0456D|nr:class I SAM-dependent methyltransferase [Kangiella sp. HZ709]MRX28341.1 methyltransferase [Kangiella sp. HZ709]